MDEQGLWQDRRKQQDSNTPTKNLGGQELQLQHIINDGYIYGQGRRVHNADCGECTGQKHLSSLTTDDYGVCTGHNEGYITDMGSLDITHMEDLAMIPNNTVKTRKEKSKAEEGGHDHTELEGDKTVFVTNTNA